MKKIILSAFVCFMLALPAQAAPELGKAAPDFTVTDINGQAVHLGNYKGKVVILEWTNHLCPFVRKQYEAGAMQKAQKIATDDGAVWISIVSSAPGLQGHVTKEEAQKIIDDSEAVPSAKILDESGALGRLYEAKTTPHMFVIDKSGTLVYNGAIDDQPTPRSEDIEKANNYVLAALNDLKAGRKVTVSSTEAYGCGVKYAP